MRFLTGRPIDYQALGTNLLSNLLLLLSAGLTCFCVLCRILLLARRRWPESVATDWIVVPGHALHDGQPSREFRLRLRRAMRILQRIPRSRLLILGGRAPGQPISEALAGARYLEALGVPGDRLVLEEYSQNTLENFQHALSWLSQRGSKELVLVTSRYHLARACAMAGNLGLSVRGYPADLKLRWCPQLAVRLVWEAYLLHWYYTGFWFARLSQNRAMLRRVQRRNG